MRNFDGKFNRSPPFITYMQINSPAQILEQAIANGRTKADRTARDTGRMFVSAILAGAFIALGGILSMTAGFGMPAALEGNPTLCKLLAGFFFPIGLILVVTMGTELFTGNNAMMIPARLRGHYSWTRVAANWGLVYAGNFVGALLFTVLLVQLCGVADIAPVSQAAVNIATSKVSMPWITVFLKGIGANWLVCLGVWLGMSGKSLLDKAFGCWLPVMAFVALGYEHCIANMLYFPLGIMQGADITVSACILDNLIPATLGNIAGGALLVGALHHYLHSPKPE